MQVATKLRALRKALDQQGRVKGDEVIFFCPKHGSKAGRTDGQLSINLKTDNFNCWSCGFGNRNIVPLLRLRGNTPELMEYIEELEKKSPRKGTRCTWLSVPDDRNEKVYDQPYLPAEFKTLTEPSNSPYYKAATGYLASRGIHSDDILRWKLGYCEEGEYRHRIIIPSFDDRGELNYAVARAFYDDAYRYKPVGRLRKDIIWNDYMIDWTSSIVVTEGPFDAFVAGENATILQGTILPKSLIKKIVLSGVDVYFAMDADAFRRQLDHIELFLSYGVGCHYVDVRGQRKKDVGAMTKEQFSSCKENAMLIKNELDLMKVRLLACG